MNSKVHAIPVIAPAEPEAYVDAERAAEFLGLDRRTVLRWAREGKIPSYPYPVGNRFRSGRVFKLSILDKWMKGEVDSQGRPYPGKATKCA